MNVHIVATMVRMKLISWNVNGLRAVVKKGLWEPFLALDADIFTLQETKATPEQLPGDVLNIAGYHAYFTHPEEKKGYNGVALYAKQEPTKVTYGMGVPALDREGRLITAFYDRYVICACYFPNGGGLPERFEYKLDFFDAFLAYVNDLRAEGYSIIFTGDVNVAHNEIDLAHPATNVDNPGFRIEVREWVDEVVRNGYVDTFRHRYPTEVKYSYWDMKTRARDRNVGWRIDYVFISNDLLPKLKNVFILNDIFGSDHCPVGVEIDL